MFSLEGFHCIDQLVKNSDTVEKLSEWLAINKGQAVLIKKYNEEDIVLVRMGTFTMDIGPVSLR